MIVLAAGAPSAGFHLQSRAAPGVEQVCLLQQSLFDQLGQRVALLELVLLEHLAVLAHRLGHLLVLFLNRRLHPLLECKRPVVALVRVDVDRVLACTLGRGQQHPGRLLTPGRLDPRHGQGHRAGAGSGAGPRTRHARVDLPAVDLVARLGDFLFEIEVDLLQPGLHLLEGEDRLVDDHHAQGRRNALAAGVGHLEGDLRIGAGQVSLAVAADLYPQVVGGVHNRQSPVADHHAVGAEHVGAYLNRARQVGVERDLVSRLAVGQLKRPGQVCLAVLDHVHVQRARLASRHRLERHVVAHLVEAAVGPQQNAVVAGLGLRLEVDLGLARVALGILCGQRHRHVGARLRGDRDLGEAAVVGLDHDGLAAGRVGPCDLARCGRGVGVGGHDVDAVLEPADQVAAFRDGGDDDRRTANRHVTRDLLGVVARVGDLDVELRRGLARLERLAHEVVGQLHLERVVALLVGGGLDHLEVGVLHVELGARNGHLCAGHRLAEEVVRLEVNLHRLAGAIEFPVGLEGDLELGQDVAVDVDALFLLGPADYRADFVRSLVELVGQHEVRVRDAELVRLANLLEDLVALGVLHFEDRLDLHKRLHARLPQRQRPHVNRLAGLVQRLVARQERPRGARDVYRLLDHVFGGAALDQDRQPRALDLSIGQRKRRTQLPASVRDALVTRDRLVLVHQREGYLRPGHRLAGRAVPHDHANHRPRARQQLAVEQDRGLQNLLEEVEAASLEFPLGGCAVAEVILRQVLGVDGRGHLDLDGLAAVYSRDLGQHLAGQVEQLGFDRIGLAGGGVELELDAFL